MSQSRTEWQFAFIGTVVIVSIGFICLYNSEIWQRLFYPSLTALPFDPTDDAGKVAFHAQQPYQGYYGAWVQFAAAILTVLAAIGTIFALNFQTSAASRASLRATRAEDRRSQLQSISRRAAIAATCAAEFRTLQTHYVAALLQHRQERAARSFCLHPMGEYPIDRPRVFELRAPELADLGAAEAHMLVELRQDFDLVMEAQGTLKRRSDHLAETSASKPHPRTIERKIASANAWQGIVQVSLDKLRFGIEILQNDVRRSIATQQSLVDETEADRKELFQD